jgi:hypothetical protein
VMKIEGLPVINVDEGEKIPKRISKPKSGRDATPADRYCFLSVRGICTCC